MAMYEHLILRDDYFIVMPQPCPEYDDLAQAAKGFWNEHPEERAKLWEMLGGDGWEVVAAAGHSGGSIQYVLKRSTAF